MKKGKKKKVFSYPQQWAKVCKCMDGMINFPAILLGAKVSRGFTAQIEENLFDLPI